MLKNLKVSDKKTGERLVGCVILKETPQSYVFIRLNSLMRTDYDRIVKIMEETDKELLEAMRDTRLPNGMLALNVWKDIIEVKMKEETPPQQEVLLTEKEAVGQLQDAPKAKAPEVPVKRKPGRPRKNPPK